MDYSLLNKADLVNIAKELANKVEAQKHLAEAVDAKDREILTLKTVSESDKKLVRDLNQKVASQQHLSEAVIQKDKDIVELNKLIVELKSKSVNANGLETKIKQLEEANKRLTDILNPYILSFRATLKAFQGTLELSIENEALLSEKLINKEANK